MRVHFRDMTMRVVSEYDTLKVQVASGGEWGNRALIPLEKLHGAYEEYREWIGDGVVCET